MPAPDEDFHANCKIKLSHGVTAFRLLSSATNNGFSHLDKKINISQEPLIVCLHGFSNSSYMWENIANLLSKYDQGPCAQVLVFDFYGRGRSEWTGLYGNQLMEVF
jgi:pimeloyl-ACP methyl ester carboxylesterase